MRARRHTRKRQPARLRGLTLVELLVTLTLLALLAGAALPALGALLQRRRLEGASSQLISDLQLLRTSAVARHRALRLSLQDLPEGSCRMIHDGEAGDCRCQADARLQPLTECRTGVTLLQAALLPRSQRLRLQSNAASLRLEPRHGTLTPTATIEIASEDSTQRLRHVVSLLGRIRVCAPAAPVPGVPAC